MIIDHPKLKARLEKTYTDLRKQPREAARRLAAVFKNDEGAIGKFLEDVSSKRSHQTFGGTRR